MYIINTYEAKTRLSQLLVEVQKGKEVIIGKAGTPIAKLVPFGTFNKKRIAGQLVGKINIARDFDNLPEELTQYFT